VVSVINVKYKYYIGNIPMGTAKKEVQDTSCRGTGDVPLL